MLIPKISAYVANSCKTLIIKDITGIYNATTNIGGYGAPNTEIGDITNVEIRIISSNQSYSIINPIGLPTTDGTFKYEVPSSILSPIPDGIYKLEYILTAGAEVFTDGPKYKLFTCNIECCVQKMFRDIIRLKCDCHNPLVKNALYASALLLGLEANKECGNILVLNEILVKLNQICGFTSQNCGCQ